MTAKREDGGLENPPYWRREWTKKKIMKDVMSEELTKEYILDFTQEELAEKIAVLKEPNYRAGQIFQWIYRRRVNEFSQMSNLSKQLRTDLAEKFYIMDSKLVTKSESSDGTTKYLLEFSDNRQVEAVLIPAKEHLTACLSTQFGCPVKCAFCATGQGPFLGDMSAGQIVEEFLQLQIQADLLKERISHIVFMGMGEPLFNYDNLIKAIRIINSDWGFNIGARKITISTVGIPDRIRQLAKEGLQFNLALSLHVVDQKIREELIPIAKKYPLDKVIDAVVDYFDWTGREVTLEYLLLKDINVSSTDAERLAKIARKVRANVNLIVYNPTSGKYQPPSQQVVTQFLKHLKDLGANAHMRASRGKDIEAACGQLKKRNMAGLV
jgi:23S rRNA (adenine2503-C2)-methyltransferase